MFVGKISKVKKREGTVVDFDRSKIIDAVKKACNEVNVNQNISEQIVRIVELILFERFSGRIPSVENIQDIVEEVLIKKGYAKVAKAYILYRERKKELRSSKAYFGVKDDLKLSLNAVKVLQRRYLLKNDNGEIIETPLEMFRRVSKSIAAVDSRYNKNIEALEEEFFEVMSKLEFLPNSPCLMNAGTRIQQLSACFVLGINDSLEEIFDTLKTAALIQKTGGGTGFSFSNLRPEGAIVSSTKGFASGPVSFMSLFDKTTDVIKMGGRRRGANMGVLSVNHPDIMKFISCKNKNEFSNFNISVRVDDEFMNAVIKNKSYDLRFEDTKIKMNARNIFDAIVNEAWNNGDPGLVFIDEINRKRGSKEKIEATNPCGEQPLLANESCVLGSINLTKFVHNKKIDWNKLRKVVRIAVHFLDNVIDANDYITREIQTMTLGNRKIGLGIMGWAEMLILMGIEYDSNKALRLGESLMYFINKEARKKSYELALERGNFPNFEDSFLKHKYKFMRNLTVTTIAPTGTISIIANGCSSGIEPLFAINYMRNILDGTKLIETNRLFEMVAESRKFYSSEMMHEISRSGSIQSIKSIPKDVRKLFVTALDIKPEWHVKMQAAFQKHVDNGVSKTVNLLSTATKEDVKRVYLLAYKLNCKGITVFRYGSKENQVLYVDKLNVVSDEFSGGCPELECGN